MSLEISIARHQTENCLSFSNCRWIGGGEGGGGGIHETFGSFATQGYMYGREWLAGQVRSTPTCHSATITRNFEHIEMGLSCTCVHLYLWHYMCV